METKTQPKKSDADQRNTRDRILLAAAKMFAEHGFKGSTTRMICSEARVNVALINYHFRSKAGLYKTVIGTLIENVAKPLMSIPDAVHDEKTWKLAVRSLIRRTLAICAARKPPEVWMVRLMFMEECVPSDLAQDIDSKFKMPLLQCFTRLLRMGMSSDDPEQIGLWCSALHAQSVVCAIGKPDCPPRYCPPHLDMDVWLDKVADHMCSGIFSRLSFQRSLCR
jgi:AcrR family transcriptional regulator